MRAIVVVLPLAGCAAPLSVGHAGREPVDLGSAPLVDAPVGSTQAATEIAVDGRLYATRWRLYYYVNVVRVLREIKADPQLGDAITELDDAGCPVSLDALERRDALTVDAWNQPLALACDPVSQVVTIRSAGPDGTMGTGDDLSSADNPPPEQMVDASCRYLERAGVETIACGVAFTHASTRQGYAHCDDLLTLLSGFAEHANWTWEDRLYPQELCRQGAIYIPELVCLHQFERVRDAKLCSIEHSSHWHYFEKNLGRSD